MIQGPKSDFTGIPPGEDFIGAGQREITNSLSLDGITIMNNLITVTTVTPNVDAVEEVQIQNGNYTAQYGSYMGVHINLVTKSGTNSLHGAVFEFLATTSSTLILISILRAQQNSRCVTTSLGRR